MSENDGLEENIELDADGRHWIVVDNGVRIGGFKTEAEARRFLDSGVAVVLVPGQKC
jgi:hypothetical protein